MTRAFAAALLLIGLSSAVGAQNQTIVTSSAPPPPPPPSDQTPLGSDASSQTAHLSGPALYSISGIVVSGTTGTPLDRAEVTLTTPGERGSPVAEAITGENGTFRFDHLQAGRYRLSGSRRGYITAGYQDHDGFYTGIVAGPSLSTAGLRLELRPTAIIGGVVTDDAGEPVAGAQVRLYRQDQHNGESRVIGAGGGQTDDTGSYEFARLRPGTYYVSVSTNPWYAFHPQPKTDDNDNPLPADQQPHSPLDVAYSTAFYASATDSESATPITINAGDHVEANLSMHAVPSIHIQIRLPPPVEGRGVPMPQLMQEAFGSEQPQFGNQVFMRSRNGGPMLADISGIAPGHYVFRQYGQQGEATRIANVDLTSDQSVDFASATASGVDVSGKVAMISGGKLPDRTTVQLVPAGNNASASPVRVGADGAFEIHSVSPGVYELQVHASGSTLAAAQMAVSGAESRGTRITVGTEPVLIAATLATGSTTITGYAKQNGKGFGGAMILLVPSDPNASPELYRRDQSNTDGSFTLSRVIPGNYTAVAIENGWTLDWARREVMAPYLAGGIQVRVTGQKTLEFPTALEVQRR
jgi:hypothetical protein